MSIGRWGASWAASTKSSAPWWCATAASWASGQTSPVTFEAPVTATRSIRDGAARSACSQRSTSSETLLGIGSTVTSWRRHGSMLAWCSTDVLSTRAPAGSAAARTLIASVVLRTKTTVPSRAPTNSATAPRAAS
jgi:hypothetical protein